MNTSSIIAMSEAQYQQQLVDTIWHAAVNQIRGGCAEIVLTAYEGRQIGQSGINVVAQRFSVLIKDRASVLYDPAIDAIRILPPPRVQVQFSNQQLAMRGRVPATLVSSPESELVSSESEASPTSQQVSRRAEFANRSKIAKERISKVPRPPNAFILYRQHHHPMVKQNNPGVHNNQISVLLGRQWKNEDPAVKAAFKEKADEVKRKHNEKHPEYQYQPRKPSEKKKRASRVKAAKVAASTSPIDSPPPFVAETSFTSSPNLNSSPTHEPFVPQTALPSFHFTEDGQHMVHDFSLHDPALFDDMVNNYNATPGLIPAAHQGYISPQALVLGPSIASSREYAADASHLNYPSLDSHSEELRDRLKAELSIMNNLFVQGQASMAVDVAAPTRTTITTDKINASEDAYNNAWKDTARDEDLRMEQLELEFGDGAGSLNYADLYFDGDYVTEPIFGSDGIDTDADYRAREDA